MSNNIEDLFESMSYLPVDVRRNLLLVKELDTKERKLHEDLQEFQNQLLTLMKFPPSKEKDKLLADSKDKIEKTHLTSLALRREKISITEQTYNIIYSYNQQIDQEVDRFVEEFKSLPVSEIITAQVLQEESNINTRQVKSQRNREPPPYQPIIPQYDSYQYTAKGVAKDKNKKKAQITNNFIENEIPLDETQNQLYCICQKPSYGTMVACDNPNCRFEWFHIECVGLLEVPSEKQKWYCQVCTELHKK